MEAWTRWCFLEMSICCAVGLEGNTRRITIAYISRKISSCSHSSGVLSVSAGEMTQPREIHMAK